MDKKDKILVLSVTIFIAAFAIYQIIRPAPTYEITGRPATYKAGNHVLQVYISSSPLEFKTYDELLNDSAADKLEYGDLYYIANDNTVTVIKRTTNYPQDNVSKYEYKEIYKIKNQQPVQGFVLNVQTEHLLNKDDDIADEVNQYYSIIGILGRSLPLTDYIRWQLLQAGWDGKTDFKAGNFRYTAAGFYGTTTKTPVKLYDRQGNEIKTLPAGTAVYATMNLPFATGHSRPETIRIIAYGNPNNLNVGTYFIDGYTDDGQPTIETLPISQDKRD